MGSAKRILIVTVNWLGDAIMTTPILKAVKSKYPYCYLSVMCVERVAGVYDSNPYVDEVIVFDERTTHKSFFAKLKFAIMLRKKHMDTVYFIHRSMTKALVCFLAGIKTRIGYSRLKTAWLMTKEIKPSPLTLHRADKYAYLFNQCKIPVNDKLPQMFFSERDIAYANEFIEKLQDKSSYIVGVNPAANWRQKRWAYQKFARLCDLLTTKLNCTVIFIGASSDSEIINNVISGMRTNPINLCGKTTVSQLAALISRLDLFLSNDSGPAHMAAAVNTVVLTLFGPTAIELTGPRGRRVDVLQKRVECELPCYIDDCENIRCMDAISVDEVYSKCEQLLTNE